MRREKRSIFRTVFQIGLGVLCIGLVVRLIIHKFSGQEEADWKDWLNLVLLSLLGFINTFEGLGYNFTNLLKKWFRIKSED